MYNSRPSPPVFRECDVSICQVKGGGHGPMTASLYRPSVTLANDFIRALHTQNYHSEKYFSFITSTGISLPVHNLKASAPWYSSIYMPLKVGHPRSLAMDSSLVSLGL